MQSYYITHFLNEQLPKAGNYKQVSFLTATPESYADGIFYLGYSGRRKLTEAILSDELDEKRIVKLVAPIAVSTKKYLWIDGDGKLWLSDDEKGMEKEQPDFHNLLEEITGGAIVEGQSTIRMLGALIAPLLAAAVPEQPKPVGVPQAQQSKPRSSSRG
jgi:hypothetical protein